MLSEICPEYVKSRVESLAPWLHKIDLGNGIVTPGHDWDEMWACTRSLCDEVDYRGKRVLDVASWDGYWALEAEKRGAAFVIASDSRPLALKNFLFCKEVLKSKVIPFYNVSVNDLKGGVWLKDCEPVSKGVTPKFDIVQHFGLLYHLKDPYKSLSESHDILEEDGTLILETACVLDRENPIMLHNGDYESPHFYGISDVWAPSLLCLDEMLKKSGFLPSAMDTWKTLEGNKVRVGDGFQLGRVTLTAKKETNEIFNERRSFRCYYR